MAIQLNGTLQYEGEREISINTTLTTAQQGTIRVSGSCTLTLPTTAATYFICPQTDNPEGLVDEIELIIKPAASQRLYGLNDAPAVAKGVVYKGVGSSACAMIQVNSSANAVAILQGDWTREA